MSGEKASEKARSAVSQLMVTQTGELDLLKASFLLQRHIGGIC